MCIALSHLITGIGWCYHQCNSQDTEPVHHHTDLPTALHCLPPPSLTPANSNLFSISITSSSQGYYIHTYKPQSMCLVWDWLCPLDTMLWDPSKLLHMSTVCSFLSLSSIHAVDELIHIIHFGCFQLLAVTNKAAMNTCIQVLMWT